MDDWLLWVQGLVFFSFVSKRKEAKENRLIPRLGTEFVLGGK